MRKIRMYLKMTQAPSVRVVRDLSVGGEGPVSIWMKSVCVTFQPMHFPEKNMEVPSKTSIYRGGMKMKMNKQHKIIAFQIPNGSEKRHLTATSHTPKLQVPSQLLLIASVVAVLCALQRHFEFKQCLFACNLSAS